MEKAPDSSVLRVGINLGAADHGVSMSKMMETLNEFISRMMNLIRLTIVIAPIVHQSIYLHTVDFGTWLVRLTGIMSCVGVVVVLMAPEQAYNGMALRHLRPLFEMLYPEAIKSWNGSPQPEPAETGPSSLLQGLDAGELSGMRVHLRVHGTQKYIGVNGNGWAVPGEEDAAAVFVLAEVFAKGDKVPDTYTVQVDCAASRWDQCSMSFQAVNHLRFGGWFGAFRGKGQACPYKVIRDSDCPPGACKLLAAWPNISPLTQRYCTGFYLAEQLYGQQVFIGHAPDRDAALLELVMV